MSVEQKSERGVLIVSAAARVIIGEEEIVITSVRHFDSVYHDQAKYIKLGVKERYPYLSTAQINELFMLATQGFIDNKRVFHNRTDAWKIASAAGQIRYRCGGDETDGGTLYSENLY